MSTTADAKRLDARGRAMLRGAEIARNDLIAAGGALSLAQVQALLAGASPEQVERLVGARDLLAVPCPDGLLGYPAFQFLDDGSVVPGLNAMFAALPTKSPWGALNFLVHPDHRLNGERPIDVLKRGDVDLVVAAAAAMGQQGW